MKLSTLLYPFLQLGSLLSNHSIPNERKPTSSVESRQINSAQSHSETAQTHRPYASINDQLKYWSIHSDPTHNVSATIRDWYQNKFYKNDADAIKHRQQRALAKSHQATAHHVDLSETEIFQLFGMSPDSPNHEVAVTNQTITDLSAIDTSAEQSSATVYDLTQTYIDSKMIKTNNKISEALMGDYLDYPTKLDLSYTTEASTDCSTETIASIDQAAQHISQHTQFSLSKIEDGQPADIHINLIKPTQKKYIGSGNTQKMKNSFYEKIFFGTVLGDSTNFTQQQIANIVDTTRSRYADRASIGLYLCHPLVTPDLAWLISAHEFLHAFGLQDIVWAGLRASIEESKQEAIRTGDTNRQDLISGIESGLLSKQLVILENTIMAYQAIPIVPEGFTEKHTAYPRSLMPYDIATLDSIANWVRQQNNITDNPLKNKSPYRGDTLYRFIPDNNAIEIDDDHQTRNVVLPNQAGYMQMTVIDPNGYDTFDFREFHKGVKVDLTMNGVTTYDARALARSRAVKTLPNNTIEYSDYFARGNIYLPASINQDYLIERVFGGSGNDVIIGNQLDNDFYPGRGHDVVTGGQGKDKFFFKPGDHKLMITDFDIAHDVIVLHPDCGLTNFNEVQRHLYTKANGDVKLHFPHHHTDSIILQGIRAASRLRPENFLYHRY